jgi:hypothetical protein
MAKWYVQSGQVQGIVNADGPVSACQQIIHPDYPHRERLSRITTVSETGFAITEQTIVMLTSQLLGDSP